MTARGPLIVRLRGALDERDAPRRPDSDHDAYSLFVSRAVALGLQAPSSGLGLPGAWGMNDAELDVVDGEVLAWFQVAPAPSPTGPPVQAVADCARAVVERYGRLTLDELSVVADVEPATHAGLALAAGLAHLDVVGGAELLTVVTEVSGPDAPEGWADAVAEDLASRDTGRFTVRPVTQGAGPYAGRRGAVPPHVLVEEPRAHLAAAGVAPEWSVAQAAWAAALALDAAGAAGVRGQATVTVLRGR